MQHENEEHADVSNKAERLIKHSAARSLHTRQVPNRSHTSIQSMQRHLRLCPTCENMCSSLHSLRTNEACEA